MATPAASSHAANPNAAVLERSGSVFMTTRQAESPGQYITARTGGRASLAPFSAAFQAVPPWPGGGVKGWLTKAP
jgi:hypothetical protein